VLQVTSAAMSTFEQARGAQELPESVGVRIFAQRDEQGEVGIALAFAEQPQDGDQVTETDGTAVFVAPELAEPLGDSVLDVEDGPEGAQIVLTNQDEGASS
jgi:Fe-S cluster assembly iron-binding protein IscA